MELMQGYKQTEVGVIPVDWNVDAIMNVASVTTGDKNTQDKKEEGLYPFYVRSATIERIDSYSCDCEGVLTAGDGVGTGKIFHYVNGRFDFHQRVYLIHNFAEVLDAFYFYLYFSQSFYSRMMQMTAKSSVDSVRREMIANMRIPLPPVQEQRVIAAALSDVDALIASLDRLIAKKRDIKQGMMQALLTGNRRLKGFTGDWEVKKLRDLCRLIIDGNHFTPNYTPRGIPFYAVENVIADDFSNSKFISTSEHLLLIKRCKPEKGDILMTRIGTVGCTKLIDWDINASIIVNLALLKLNDMILPIFFNCYSKSEQFVKDVEDRSLLNATPKKINLREIGEVPIPVPTLEEQIAIANILSDLQEEISTLEDKLDKTQMLKQGMMHELLTGRIRLV